MSELWESFRSLKATGAIEWIRNRTTITGIVGTATNVFVSTTTASPLTNTYIVKLTGKVFLTNENFATDVLSTDPQIYKNAESTDIQPFIEGKIIGTFRVTQASSASTFAKLSHLVSFAGDGNDGVATIAGIFYNDGGNLEFVTPSVKLCLQAADTKTGYQGITDYDEITTAEIANCRIGVYEKFILRSKVTLNSTAVINFAAGSIAGCEIAISGDGARVVFADGITVVKEAYTFSKAVIPLNVYALNFSGTGDMHVSYTGTAASSCMIDFLNAIKASKKNNAYTGTVTFTKGTVLYDYDHADENKPPVSVTL